MQPLFDKLSDAIAIGDADALEPPRRNFARRRPSAPFPRISCDVEMKPKLGDGLAPHIAVTLAELERIGCAATTQGPWGDRALDQPRRRGETIKPLRVLVVEDDLMIGPLLAELLEDLGHVVCAVEINANAAVASARRCHPDLMIVDVGLGEVSGIAAVKEILKEGFVPHVFVTGDVLRGLSLGPDAVLIQKPYRGTDLVAAIARAIAGRTS